MYISIWVITSEIIYLGISMQNVFYCSLYITVCIKQYVTIPINFYYYIRFISH